MGVNPLTMTNDFFTAVGVRYVDDALHLEIVSRFMEEEDEKTVDSIQHVVVTFELQLIELSFQSRWENNESVRCLYLTRTKQTIDSAHGSLTPPTHQDFIDFTKAITWLGITRPLAIEYFWFQPL